MSRADEMRELFARWKSSGQSLMAFGKRESVPYSQLLYWRRKLGDEAKQQRREPSTQVAALDLVPVNVLADSKRAAPSGSKFEVWLANGVSLDVTPGFDESELRRLVGVLQSC